MWTNNKLAVVQDIGGCCSHCGKVCRYPWQSQKVFLAELLSMGRRGEAQEATKHPRRYLIQVVHLNRRPEDDRCQNLKPLCLPCAMGFRALTRRRPIFGGRRKYL